MSRRWHMLTLEEKTQRLMAAKGISWREARRLLGQHGAAVRAARKLKHPVQYGGKAAIAAYRGPKLVLVPAELTTQDALSINAQARQLRQRPSGAGFFGSRRGQGELGALVWLMVALVAMEALLFFARQYPDPDPSLLSIAVGLQAQGGSR